MHLSPEPFSIIDTDIHEAFTSLQDLVPYLQEPWKGLIAREAWRGFAQPFAYWSTGGLSRADAKPEKGPAGSDYALMSKQLLDLYDITYPILTGYFYPAAMQMQFEFAAALACAYNDWLIEHWLDRDPRLRGSIHVAPQDPQAAVREIERLAEHPQMIQVMLPIAQRAYGDPFYHPIFEAAQRHHLVIAMHHTIFVQGALGMGRYYIERHMIIPQSFMSELISLVVNGVFDLFPDLHFALLEGGFSWLPHLMWRFEREYKSLHQEIPWVKRNPAQHIRERVKFSTQPTEDLSAQNWLRLMDMMGSDQMLMFASDYPHFDFDSPQESIPHDLPERVRQRIFFENANDLYHFEQVR
ncbi:amidohydrolase [Ktedonosporobacter rubrisoli]|uniref:Amidohydrolase n=2 Tax=Ktedonosporobacter rubrisoli TaxID=2509675 RepID=A0A4P6K743_KTERU|nr:amidohydrolase [Ktedonosporobacter rubrisoli]